MMIFERGREEKKNNKSSEVEQGGRGALNI